MAALGLVLCLLAGAFGVASLYVPGLALMLLAAGAETSVRLASRSGGVWSAARRASAGGVDERAARLALGADRARAARRERGGGCLAAGEHAASRRAIPTRRR